jgi:hypothetical protein
VVEEQLSETILVLVCARGRLNCSYRQTHPGLRRPERPGSSDVMIEIAHLLVGDFYLD